MNKSKPNYNHIENISHEEYYEGIEKEILEEKKSPQNPPPTKEKFFNVKHIKIMAIALVVTISSLLIIFNFDNLSFDKINYWIKNTLTGTLTGDGFPVNLVGSNVYPSNFFCDGTNVVTTSDTALTITESNGKEKLNFRHSYSSPSMACSNSKYLLHNIGGQSYSIIKSNGDVETFKTENKISCADISSDGTYAIGTQPSDYTSNISVFYPSGSPKFVYNFSTGYIVDLTLSQDGNFGAVALANSSAGTLYTQIYIFDFKQSEPIASYKTNDNLISKITYNNDKQFYFIGDKALVRANNKNFEEFNYQGKTLTAYCQIDNKIAISLTSYSGNGPCTVYTFDNSISPFEFDTTKTVEALSGIGTTVAVLTDKTISSYSFEGEERGICNAGYDAVDFSLISERNAYILGLSEIRLEIID